jgi:uncharacterized protein YecE (DUF72 family)
MTMKPAMVSMKTDAERPATSRAFLFGSAGNCLSLTAMEFGKVHPSLLGTIAFALPEDGSFTRGVLPGERAERLKVYVGAPKWARSEWLGIIYPEGLKEKDHLAHYVRHFNSIELNATHYKIYPESTTRKWADTARGRDFRFCPKVPQSISHYSELSSLRAKELTDQFLQGIIGFGETLGPVFLQLSEKYGPQRREQLLQYLEQWPKDLELFVEVRHPDWFGDPSHREWLFGHLHRLGLGAVITDTAGRRDCAHMELTVPKTMIRFVGNGKHPTDYTRIDEWIERLDSWIANGLEELWFFVHQPHELYSPEIAACFIEKINAKCQLSLVPPQFIVQEKTLFD